MNSHESTIAGDLGAPNIPDAFLFWVFENVVFPLVPLLAAWVALLAWNARPTVVALFGDGGLMFYATSLSVSLVFDAVRDAELRSPRVPVWVDNSIMLLAALLALCSSIVFGMIALARADPASSVGARYNAKLLASWSWQVAVWVAILSTIYRALTGLF